MPQKRPCSNPHVTPVGHAYIVSCFCGWADVAGNIEIANKKRNDHRTDENGNVSKGEGSRKIPRTHDRA